MCQGPLRPTSPTRWLGHLLEQLIEAGVLRLDGGTQLREVAVEIVERPGGEATRTALTVDATDDEAGLLEDLEMSRDRGLGHRKRGGELAGSGLPLDQPKQNLPAVGIGESGETSI